MVKLYFGLLTWRFFVWKQKFLLKTRQTTRFFSIISKFIGIILHTIFYQNLCTELKYQEFGCHLQSGNFLKFQLKLSVVPMSFR